MSGGPNQLLRIRMEDDRAVVVEITEDDPGFRPAGGSNAILEAKVQLEKALADIHAAAAKALATFRDGSLAPDQVEIDFGIRFSAEIGAVVAKTTGEGHFNVKLIWSDAQAASARAHSATTD